MIYDSDNPGLRHHHHQALNIPRTSVEINDVDSFNSSIKRNRISIKTVLKYFSLFLLIFQSATHVIVLRFSRVSTGDMYVSSTAVFLAEVLKLAVCLLMMFLEIRSIPLWLEHLNMNLFKNFTETLRVVIPAFIFALQSNLQYFALSNLDPASFLVSYQLKTLFTAIFSAWILGRKFKSIQWLSLILLFIGLAIVQLQPSQMSTTASALHNQAPFNGLLAVLGASVGSGAACVYFENVLKQSNASIWTCNVQLAFFTAIISFLIMIANNGSEVIINGIFFGYTNIVWFNIALQALGGVLVALSLKFADSLCKCYSSSLAIILSCLLSIYMFNFVFSIQFIFGTSLVVLAIYIYSPLHEKKTTLL